MGTWKAEAKRMAENVCGFLLFERQADAEQAMTTCLQAVYAAGRDEGLTEAARMNGNQTQYGWLIEFPGAFPAWWDGRGLDTGVTDANDAVRFARREDAERVAIWLIKRGWLITEHGWANLGGGGAGK